MQFRGGVVGYNRTDKGCVTLLQIIAQHSEIMDPSQISPVSSAARIRFVFLHLPATADG